MATIDKLIHDILAPVELGASRLAPKVLAWFDTPAAEVEGTTASWDWLDSALPAEPTQTGMEITEHPMPMEALCALFGLAQAPRGGVVRLQAA